MLAIHPSRGAVRPRKRVVRSLVALLVAAGSAAALAGPAQAYDGLTCNEKFGWGNVSSSDQFSLDTGSIGKVDFGDNHVNHVPLGTAVVCWAKTGQVSIHGRLYADPHSGTATVSMNLVFYNNGSVITSWASPNLDGAATTFGAANKLISLYAPGTYDKVRIRLISGGDVRKTHWEYR
jgi:hypothetical protein